MIRQLIAALCSDQNRITNQIAYTGENAARGRLTDPQVLSRFCDAAGGQDVLEKTQGSKVERG